MLLESSRATQNKRRTPCNTQPDSDADWAAKLEKAEKLAGQGELSSAARLLRSNGLAPGNNNTLQQLCDPLLRPRHRLLDFPPEVLNYTPDEPVQMDRDLFIANLRSARRGLSGSLSGHRNEHLKCALDDEGSLNDLCDIAQSMAEGDLPMEITDAFRLCKLTAIRKNAHKVRVLNAADCFKRLVARTLPLTIWTRV